MDEKEARELADLKNRERRQEFCPTIKADCQSNCICFVPSHVYEAVGGRGIWKVVDVGCTHKDHQLPHRPFDNMPCTFPPHPVVKKDE